MIQPPAKKPRRPQEPEVGAGHFFLEALSPGLGIWNCESMIADVEARSLRWF